MHCWRNYMGSHKRRITNRFCSRCESPAYLGFVNIEWLSCFKYLRTSYLFKPSPDSLFQTIEPFMRAADEYTFSRLKTTAARLTAGSYSAFTD